MGTSRMANQRMSESAKRALRLICRQGGVVRSLIIPTEDLTALTAAGYLVEVLGGWKATKAGYAFDKRNH